MLRRLSSSSELAATAPKTAEASYQRKAPNSPGVRDASPWGQAMATVERAESRAHGWPTVVWARAGAAGAPVASSRRQDR